MIMNKTKDEIDLSNDFKYYSEYCHFQIRMFKYKDNVKFCFIP